MNGLQAKANSYGLKLDQEKEAERKVGKEVEGFTDRKRHLDLEIEMLVREIELLEKKHNRETGEAERGVKDLYDFVAREWDDEIDNQTHQMKEILELFGGLGEEGIRQCEAWMLSEGYTKEQL